MHGSTRRTMRATPAEFPAWLLIAAGTAVTGMPGLAAAGDEPEMEFLEYLGSWEGSDDEWQMLESAMLEGEDLRTETRDTDEEPAEKDDES